MVERNNSILICGIPRTGSTYLAYALASLLENSYTKCDSYGEFFNENKYSFNSNLLKRVEEYKKVIKSDVSTVSKLFPHQIVTLSDSKDTYQKVISELLNLPQYKILIYRENLFECFMSRLIASIGSAWQVSKSSDTDKVIMPELDDHKVNVELKTLIKSVKNLIEISDNYKFNKIIKYESLTGDPLLDFNQYIPELVEDPYSVFEMAPKKVTTTEYKHKILPIEYLHEKFLLGFKEADLSTTLNLGDDGLSGINILTKQNAY